jgi:7-cyano-7-deazaguanine synthase
MKIVPLVSGGLDSTVVAALAKESGADIWPLFVDYGQRAAQRERNTVDIALERLGLRPPKVADMRGYGALIPSGLTDASLDVVSDAFTPGRNALFLLLAGSYAMSIGADAIAIGLLDEKYRLFPDQSKSFVDSARDFIASAMGREIEVLAPLMGLAKKDVVLLARERGIAGTYSCHVGEETPCGKCIACREFEGTEA